MTNIQWVPILAALLGGGAMGAIITALVTYYRNRRQPVGYKKEVIEIFRKNPEYNSLHALLSIGGTRPAIGSGSGTGFQPGAEGVLVDNFSILRYTLINKGNQDISEYKFGVTLKGSNKAVDVKVETPDRHHEMKVLRRVSLDHPTNEIDFILKPFNRRDSYSVNIYFSYDDSPAPTHLSSPHPTKFTEIASVADNIYTWGMRHETMFSLSIAAFVTSIILLFARSVYDWLSALFK